VLLGAALEPLQRLAHIADATAAEVRRARQALHEAELAVQPAKALCDITTFCRAENEPLPVGLNDWEAVKDTLFGSPAHKAAMQSNEGLSAFHFPIAFPEVFLRDRPGFDVILGNPPWEKVRFEPQQFWVTRSPGLNSLPANKREAAIEELRTTHPTDAHLEQEEMELRERLQKIINRSFQLHGRGHHGHHDFAKLFCERALDLLAAQGSLGYVIPRVALVLGGWTDIRHALLANAAVTTLQAPNRGGWLFDDLDYRIMVSLTTHHRKSEEDKDTGVWIWPSVTNEAQLRAANRNNALHLTIDEVESLTDSWVIPWFSSSSDRSLFETLRGYPRLGSGNSWILGTADSWP
jgi:hypothetical protein